MHFQLRGCAPSPLRLRGCVLTPLRPHACAPLFSGWRSRGCLICAAGLDLMDLVYWICWIFWIRGLG